jgi:aminocarboxymuconate-semialdehyde decarboxylase
LQVEGGLTAVRRRSLKKPGNHNMTIDVHAHYIPQSLISTAREQGSKMGVQVIDAAGVAPALEFSYGFKVRPFFPRLIETAAQRIAWLDSQRLDRQFVATWPDIYGYGLPREHCTAWHRVLNDTLAEWCADNAARMTFVASVPLPDADDAAAELERAARLGAAAVMVSANIEGKNIGELPLDPLWARAAQLQLPVMIHPMASAPFAFRTSHSCCRTAAARILILPAASTSCMRAWTRQHKPTSRKSHPRLTHH